MILFDMSQITLACVFAEKDYRKTYDEDILRHMIINSIRHYRQKFKKNYGEPVLCFDSSNNWRKDVFPYYKAHRAKNREASDIDWGIVYSQLCQIRQELTVYMPYPALQVDRAEADDIIGVLARRQIPGQKNMILSSDKDFKQLHSQNVTQYSPLQKEFVICPDPEKFLREHILSGDKGDGVPNVLSPDDVFLQKGVRQKPLTKKRIDEIVSGQNTDPNVKRNVDRNTKLISLAMIPEDVVESINQAIQNCKPGPRSGLIAYFQEHRMRIMLESVSEF